MEWAGGPTENSQGQMREAHAAPEAPSPKTHPSFSDAVGHAAAL